MKILKFYILILSLTIFSCQQNSQDKQNRTKETKGTSKKNAEPKFSCSRILVSFYDNNVIPSKSNKNYGTFSTELIYETKEQKIIDEFVQMTRLAFRTGYCCCPKRNYTISFYDKTNNYEDYFVDTIEFKDKVRIYQASFQFSYIVEKVKWRNYLTKLNEISFNEYFITNLKTAREVYAYTIEKDLPIITSNRFTKEWMNFDGDFKVKVAVVGEKLNEAKVYQNINMAYPKDKFKIETISQYQMCGSYDGHDCYEEIILQIFCNKDFYDKFEIYKPKSFYDTASAEFFVLGTRENLNKIDNITQKEEE